MSNACNGDKRIRNEQLQRELLGLPPVHRDEDPYLLVGEWSTEKLPYSTTQSENLAKFAEIQANLEMGIHRGGLGPSHRARMAAASVREAALKAELREEEDIHGVMLKALNDTGAIQPILDNVRDQINTVAGEYGYEVFAVDDFDQATHSFFLRRSFALRRQAPVRKFDSFEFSTQLRRTMTTDTQLDGEGGWWAREVAVAMFGADTIERRAVLRPTGVTVSAQMASTINAAALRADAKLPSEGGTAFGVEVVMGLY